jgi:DNA-binding MarR family transcriptional regulator
MDLPLDDNHGRLSYWLFYAQRCVAYAYAEVLRAHCKEHGKPYVITPPQWGALSLLLVHDGMTIGTMSQKRGVDAPAATGIITRLEQNGLVERRHDREDRRVVKVYLTDEGRDISHALASSVEHFEQSLKHGFSESQLDRLLAQLQQLIMNAAEIVPGLEDRFSLLPNPGVCGDERTKGQVFTSS